LFEFGSAFGEGFAGVGVPGFVVFVCWAFSFSFAVPAGFAAVA
jgi:hypothetical protein